MNRLARLVVYEFVPRDEWTGRPAEWAWKLEDRDVCKVLDEACGYMSADAARADGEAAAERFGVQIVM